MSKYSLDFYREHWEELLVIHIKGIIRQWKEKGLNLKQLAVHLESMSPAGNTYEECLDMVTKINSLMEKENEESLKNKLLEVFGEDEESLKNKLLEVFGEDEEDEKIN